jgi:hypothetical protein
MRCRITTFRMETDGGAAVTLGRGVIVGVGTRVAVALGVAVLVAVGVGVGVLVAVGAGVWTCVVVGASTLNEALADLEVDCPTAVTT